MPFYQYHCDPCDTDQTEMRSVSDRYDAPLCGRCGLETKLKITGAFVAPVSRAGTGSSGLTKRARAHIASQH